MFCHSSVQSKRRLPGNPSPITQCHDIAFNMARQSFNCIEFHTEFGGACLTQESWQNVVHLFSFIHPNPKLLQPCFALYCPQRNTLGTTSFALFCRSTHRLHPRSQCTSTGYPSIVAITSISPVPSQAIHLGETYAFVYIIPDSIRYDVICPVSQLAPIPLLIAVAP